ncbi:MAG TPA: ATP-dependent Clp protease ATP-binding subunit [Kofleriaceae bacterium]|nr:ATP-dependent Clp protease ATP-binding subunit [Kofleriaceae bacterium]
MRALARAAVLAVALVAVLPAASAEEAWTLGSPSIKYSVAGTVNGRKTRINLRHITDLEVTRFADQIASRARVSLIDGRILDLDGPTIAMGAAWDNPAQQYNRDADGRVHLNLHASTTLQGLVSFINLGDPALDWRPVSHQALHDVAMRRVARARDTGDVTELRASLEHARPFAFDSDATWAEFEAAEDLLDHLEGRSVDDPDDADLDFDLDDDGDLDEVEPAPEPQPASDRRKPAPRLGSRQELSAARADLLAILRQDASLDVGDVAAAAERYRLAGGRTSALRKVDRKAASRLRRLNLVHRRDALRRPFTEVPDGVAPFVARDLTALAAAGKLEQVVGRKPELRRLMQGLNRRTKPSVFLTGDPGVGKTALVEALAVKSARGDLDIPESLRGKPILELSLASFVAGTRHRGDLEERVQIFMSQMMAIPKEQRPVLFIDEGHTIVGGGAAEGGLDIGNMLKPALARGDLQVISATTSDEYDRFVQRDKALGRRFGNVFVPEPSPALATRMLRARVGANERHYKLKIDPSAVKAAVDLSVRYLPARTLPDKSQDVLEEAASRASMRGAARVTVKDVREVVTEWSKMSVRTDRAEAERLLHLEKRLGQRVFGQDEAVAELSDAYRQLRAKMKTGKNRRPANVMFLGPTGVGKTELARAFAADVFEDEEAMTRIDMSEFQEKHSVSRLIGSPNGYVNSEEQGLLTKAVRRRPFQVLVLDEIEKAHPDVQNLLLQILEDGRLSDRFGTVDFSNVVVIMTSNAVTERPRTRQKVGFAGTGDAADDGAAPDADRKTLRRALVRAGMRPELVNRIDSPVLFNSLGRGALGSIVRKMVADEGTQYGVSLRPTPAAEDELVRRGYNPELGARPLRRAVQKAGSPLAKAVLAGPAAREYQLDARGGRLTVSAGGARAPSRAARVNPKLRRRLEARRAKR